MKYLYENQRFDKINMFLNETNLHSTTVKGVIEVYQVKGEPVDGTLDRLYYWRPKVQEFIANLPENYPPERVEWFQRRNRYSRLVAMIMAMEMMNEREIKKEDLFRGQEPYRFFDDCSIEEFKEVFDISMNNETKQVWKDNYCEDGTDSDLWDTIQKTVSEVMDPEDEATETYIYQPNTAADPLKAHYDALATCYFFLTVPTKEEIIGMQFSYISFQTMIRIRNERAEEEAARVRGRGSGRGRGQRGGPEAAGVRGRGRGRGRGQRGGPEAAGVQGRGRGHGRGQRGGPL